MPQEIFLGQLLFLLYISEFFFHSGYADDATLIAVVSSQALELQYQSP